MESLLLDPSFYEPIILTLKVAAVATFLAMVCGVGAAYFMRRTEFKFKSALDTFFMLPMVLPPTVIGFILLSLLGRRSPVGTFFERLTGHPIIFTWGAAVIASSVVAFPLIYRTARTGFASIDPLLEDTARVCGASELQVLLHITIPMASQALISACILGFARSMGEFGATLMIAGNIPGKTQTLPTAIYVASESGNSTLAWFWVCSILLLSYGMMWAVNKRT